MQETKQVGVVSLPDTSQIQFRTFADETVEVLILGGGCVVGGGQVWPSRQPVQRLTSCWSVTDLVADHWWPLPGPEFSVVELTTPGTSAAVRGALERSAAVWGRQVKEGIAEATAAVRAAALETGRRQGTADVVDRLLDRLEKSGAQALVDQMAARQRPR